MIAEDQRQARDHQADFFVLKVRPRSRTEGGNPFLVQGVNERAAVSESNAVQQQRDLGVVFNDVLPFQKLHEVGEPFGLVVGVLARHAKD